MARVLLFGIGSIVGPAAAGSAADQYGLGKTFIFVAAVEISTALVRPERIERRRRGQV